MNAFHPGTPQSSEYSPAFAIYVAKAQNFPEILGKLETQLDELLALLAPLGRAAQHHKYAPGKWSIKEVVGHLSDAERVFAYRAMRIARADPTPLAPFDENAYVEAAGAEDAEWEVLLGEFEHVRRSSIQLFARMPEEAWKRTGTASGAPISVRALAYIIAGHVAHHLEILRERYL